MPVVVPSVGVLYECDNPVKPVDAAVDNMTTYAYEVTLLDGINVWYRMSEVGEQQE
ncbi:MAG: hypothetical protein LV471_02300 [Nitrosomonas sp.]|nr:hypothetical protein [Nitrosomonas sp.]